MRLALYQPDIPQNAGTLIRLGACLGIPIDIIEPCGFPLGDRGLRRAALDYADLARVVRHDSWTAFLQARRGDRLILLTARATHSYTDFAFGPEDCLILGRESRGAPAEVHDAAAHRVRIPMRAGLRPINVALAGAMVLGEGLRQPGHVAAAAQESVREESA